jgi:hypothetical protein
VAECKPLRNGFCEWDNELGGVTIGPDALGEILGDQVVQVRTSEC